MRGNVTYLSLKDVPAFKKESLNYEALFPLNTKKVWGHNNTTDRHELFRTYNWVGRDSSNKIQNIFSNKNVFLFYARYIWFRLFLIFKFPVNLQVLTSNVLLIPKFYRRGKKVLPNNKDHGFWCHSCVWFHKTVTFSRLPNSHKPHL